MNDYADNNFAIWIDSDANLSLRQLDCYRELGDGEHLIRVRYSGINPADIKHVRLGVHSTVAGYDFCGEVVATGPRSDFSIGDIVAGSTPTGLNRPQRYGSHQNYLVSPSGGILFKVPERMPLPAAAALGVIAMTAADAFFNLLRYPLMDEDLPLPAGGLLIWGATSSIGFSVLQFAQGKGVNPIIVTAHPDNFALLEKSGATHCVDFRDADAVAKIRQCAHASAAPLLNILDAIGSPTAHTAESAAACGDPGANVVTLTDHPNYRMPLAQMYMDTELNIGNARHVLIPKREADAARAFKTLDWITAHYADGFEYPKICIYSGRSDIAIAAINPRVQNANDFGKRVIEHPIRPPA